MEPTHYTPSYNPVNAEKKFVRSRPSLAFATTFLMIATLTCVGCAVMLWHAWHELRDRSLGQVREVPTELVPSTKSERLTAAAALAASIRNSSSGTAPSQPQDKVSPDDGRATAWLESVTR